MSDWHAARTIAMARIPALTDTSPSDTVPCSGRILGCFSRDCKVPRLMVALSRGPYNLILIENGQGVLLPGAPLERRSVPYEE